MAESTPSVGAHLSHTQGFTIAAMRKLAISFFTVVLLAMPASAPAQVYFDPPGSPSNKEYGAPLERERNPGGVGGGAGGSGSSGQGRGGAGGQGGGLFGEGISAQKSPEQAAREQRQRAQALKRKGEQRGADLAKKIRDEQAAAAGPNGGGPPTPGPNAPASGAGSALPWTIGIVLAVLAASGLLALAMRRRGRASPG